MGELFKDLINSLGPDKRFGLPIINLNELFNASHKLRDTPKHAPANFFTCQFGKPSLDQVQPRGARRREVQTKAGMLLQPLLHIRMRMRPVVV